jgi:branched-chain amino acid transport system substrate-binding protein
VLFIFAIVLMLLSLPGPGFAQDAIKIALVGPYSGNFSYLGACMEQGARMAIDPFNAKGGILGKKIELVLEDNQSNPGVTTQKMMKVIEKDKVNFVLVGGGTSCAVSAFEIAKREHVLTFSGDANDNSLNAEKANRYCFHIPEPNYEIVKAVAPSILEKYGKRWYFHTADYKWGWDISATFKAFLKEKEGTVVGEDLIPMEARDFSSNIINVRNAKPDVLVVLVGGMAGLAAQTQYHEFGLDKDVKRTVPLYDHDNWLITGYDIARENGVFLVEWDINIGAPGCKEFFEEYKRRKYPTDRVPIPMMDTYHSYIATRETLRIMAEAKTTNTQEIIKRLEGRTIKDSLTHSPAMIRAADHQYMRDAYVFETKKPNEVKFKGDWVKPVKRVPWKDLYRPPSISLDKEPF